jgi:hypothetical protein
MKHSGNDRASRPIVSEWAAGTLTVKDIAVGIHPVILSLCHAARGRAGAAKTSFPDLTQLFRNLTQTGAAHICRNTVKSHDAEPAVIHALPLNLDQYQSAPRQALTRTHF